MPEDLSPLADLHEQLQSGVLTPTAVIAQAQKNADDSEAEHLGAPTYLSRDPSASFEYAEFLPTKFPNTATRPALYSVPVSIKDCFDVAGTVTTCGSRFYSHYNDIATKNAWIVHRLLSAGVVITGKTHLHQLAYGITGENADYGDPLQPRDRTLLTGGSSSGAVASIQEGSAMVAVGTDTGGSIRVPAALCGLAGYRASHGLFPEEVCWHGGAHLSPSFDTLGLIFRDLRDAPVLGQTVFDLEPVALLSSPRIGIVGNDFLHDCDPDVLAAFEAWKRHLQQRGATLAPFDTAFWADCKEVFTTIQASEAAAIHRGHFAHFEPGIAERLAWGASIKPDELEALHKRLEVFRATMSHLFDRFDFLMLPCAPVSRLIASEDQSGSRTRILRYTCPISMAGLPTVTLPGEHIEPTPGAFFGTGMQLAALKNNDAALLAFAATL